MILVLCFLAVGSTTRAQMPEAPAGGLHFDAVSILPFSPAPAGTGGGRGAPFHLVNGRWNSPGSQVNTLLGLAFGVHGEQLQTKAIPEAVANARWSIQAVAAGTYTQDQFREMVKTMLVDRFHLVYHMTSVPMTVNALVVANGGPKLRPATTACVKALAGSGATGDAVTCGLSSRRRADADKPAADGSVRMTETITGYSVSMADLAAFLPLQDQNPVIDMTGLPGTYDITLSYTTVAHAMGVSADGPMPAPPPSAAAITMADAMRSTLGLELTRKKVPMPVVVIDHIEMATSN